MVFSIENAEHIAGDSNNMGKTYEEKLDIYYRKKSKLWREFANSVYEGKPREDKYQRWLKLEKPIKEENQEKT